jgi:hypothetical protein
MQVFAFHFNPPEKRKLAKGEVKKDLIFDSFCFEPENIYEKRLGSLYMAGILKNVLPQNIKILDNLARTIKDKYYRLISSSSEKSLKESLQKANESLERIVKEGNVSWLGNLSFAVVSIKDYELNFTKVGDLKVFLFRQGQTIDIDQKIKFDEIEPYPLKLFGNIISGKLAEDDMVLILTKEVLDVFSEEKLLDDAAKISLLVPAEEKLRRFKEILDKKKEQLTKISGVCLLIILSKKAFIQERKTLTEPKTLRIFSFKDAFRPLTNVLKTIRFPFRKPTLKAPQLNLKIPKPKIGQVKIPKVEIKLPRSFQSTFWKKKLKTIHLPKNIALVSAMILFLALGSFIFQKSAERQLKEYQAQLNQIQEKVSQAETYLILSENNPEAEKKANELFMEAWKEISPIFSQASSFPSDFANQVLESKNTISENLYQLSKLQTIEEPEIFFEFEAKDFVPQKMTADSQNLYFFTPYSENVYQISQSGEEKILTTNRKFDSAIPLADSILFFSKPDELITLKGGQFSQPLFLPPPYSDFSFDDVSSYSSNLFFLDAEKGRVVKYFFLENSQWGSPQLWLDSPEKANDFRSMAIDGSIWLLNKDNTVERYYAGTFQANLDLNVFPSPEYLSEILASPSLRYFYLLDPIQKRIIITLPSGEIVKQFQSEKFDNLLDLIISEDEEAIFLLNGLKVYRINL